MTNKPNDVRVVSVDLLERTIQTCMFTLSSSDYEQLRAILAQPALGEPEVVGWRDSGGRCITHGGGGRYHKALIDLDAHRAHHAELQAEIERWKAISAVQKDRMDVALELAKEHREERDPLQAEIENLKLECDAWKNTAESFEDFYRKTEVELDQLKARCDELEGLLREVVALDPRGEFMGWQLDGRIDAALSKPAGSECCTPTAEEKALLAAGDCTPEELWGGSKPTCPKCIGRANGGPTDGD